MFVTVGTDHHRFDRLVRWTDNWLAAGGCERARCLIQIGTSVEPGQAEWSRYLPFERMEALMREAAVVVSHGAGATAGLAARSGKTPIVVPRRKDLDEHVDDHQVRFARIAASRGEFALAESEEDFQALIERALERPNGGAPSRPDHLDGAVLRFEQLVDELVAPNGSVGARAS